MSVPVCQANSSVHRSRLEEIQHEAEATFHEARPVRDAELLSRSQLRARERALGEALGIARHGVLDLAELVADNLAPPTGLHSRTYQNIARLFSSRRVSTESITTLIRTMQDPEAVTAFREGAQRMFLEAGLFYYDYVPFQGAVMCYMTQP